MNRWDKYIAIIMKHHKVDVDAVLTSFSWEDYGKIKVLFVYNFNIFLKPQIFIST